MKKKKKVYQRIESVAFDNSLKCKQNRRAKSEDWIYRRQKENEGNMTEKIDFVIPADKKVKLKER